MGDPFRGIKQLNQGRLPSVGGTDPDPLIDMSIPPFDTIEEDDDKLVSITKLDSPTQFDESQSPTTASARLMVVKDPSPQSTYSDASSDGTTAVTPVP